MEWEGRTIAFIADHYASFDQPSLVWSGECCLCRLRSCRGCSHRPHIQLPQHACSSCWISYNAWEKQPFEKITLREEKVTSSDWKIRSGIFGEGGGIALPHQLQSPEQRHHSDFTEQTFLNLILNCFHCRQDEQGKPSTQIFIQCQVFIIY